jgi:hypothetical protein
MPQHRSWKLDAVGELGSDTITTLVGNVVDPAAGAGE